VASSLVESINQLKTPFVWLIGGGVMQLPYADRIAELGYRLLVTDRNPECAVAQKYRPLARGDVFLPVDVYDVAGHRALARALTTPPAAVLTGVDAGPSVSIVAEEWALPAVGYDIAETVRNKAKMRQALNLPHPIFLVVRGEDSIADIIQAWEAHAGENAYPCVVKSVNNSASRGMTLISTRTDFTDAVIQKAVSYNRDNLTEVLIEEKLNGPEIALDFFVHPNGTGPELVLANAAERFFFRFGVEGGHLNPYRPKKEIFRLAREAALKLKVYEGPFKVDMIKDTRYGWCILETATRLSGGFDHAFTCPAATGRDVVGAMLHYALTGKIDRSRLKIVRPGVACALAPIYPHGKIRGWKGIASSGTAQVYIFEHECIQDVEHCAQRPVFIIIRGDERWKVLLNAMIVAAQVQPIYIR